MSFVSLESDTFVSVVRQAIKSLCPAILRVFGADEREATKKADGSWVTETDLLVERRMTEVLTHKFPDVPVLAEEMAAAGRLGGAADPRAYYGAFLNTPYQFVIDPIDGTRNFVEGKAPFCFAAALTRRVNDGIWPEVGVVAMPLDGLIYWSDSKGVFQESIECGDIRCMQRSTQPRRCISVNSKDREWLAAHGYDLRYPWVSSGASVHDFLDTALGRITASVVGRQRVWDLMAPLALAERLGCVLRDIQSGEKISSIGLDALSSDVEKRPWGLIRKMLLARPDEEIAGLLHRRE
jgi:fructose-1,6-bisphosphatase/inositol monophosphatase family enzyme